MSGLVIVQAMWIAGLCCFAIAAIGTIRYRVTGEALEVLVLWMVVRRIPLADIVEVHRRGAFPHESWSGPRFWNAVTIRRRRGLLKNLIITPDDPDRFVIDLGNLIEANRAEARSWRDR
jgi:hypothetical protein